MTGVELVFAVLLGLVAAGIGWLMVMFRKSGQPSASDDRLESLVQSFTAQKTTLELLDQRLGQLQNQFAKDGTDLREQVGEKLDTFKGAVNEGLSDNRTKLIQLLGEIREQIGSNMGEHRTRTEEQNARSLKTLHDSMQTGFGSLHKQLGESLLRSSTDLGRRVEALTKATDDRLKEIGGQVEKRLSDGFEKTTVIFTDVIKRLALIDEAQKKITALSTDVVSLQQLLADKRSRGVFGEVQLASLVTNVMPPGSFAFQHKLPNDKVVDCILFLPKPSGTICIDAKFPLESFRTMTDMERNEVERKRAETQFKQDIKKHIKDISEKYIIRDLTADGAIMFIPAEAVFAEIQAHHPDLTDNAHANRVWLASPTTLWAILNTARSVLKDSKTREQVDIIQKHLGLLADDFQRFRKRMDNLARHISQAHDDANDVSISARKISDRFDKIERVELDGTDDSAPKIRQQE